MGSTFFSLHYHIVFWLAAKVGEADE